METFCISIYGPNTRPWNIDRSATHRYLYTCTLHYMGICLLDIHGAMKYRTVHGRVMWGITCFVHVNNIVVGTQCTRQEHISCIHLHMTSGMAAYNDKVLFYVRRIHIDLISRNNCVSLWLNCFHKYWMTMLSSEKKKLIEPEWYTYIPQ